MPFDLPIHLNLASPLHRQENDMTTAPVPPPEQQLARVEAAAMLAHWQCPHCVADLHVDAVRENLPRAIGVTHDRQCPDFVPE